MLGCLGLNEAVTRPHKTAIERFREIEIECEELKNETPLERLRFFCSLAMNGQDWLDVEPFFDELKDLDERNSN